MFVHVDQAILNVFREDPEYEAHEQQYKAIVKELLGDDDEEDEGDEGAAGEGTRLAMRLSGPSAT